MEPYNISEQLKFVYKGGKTKRFHTTDTLTAQTVAEHSFGVAWLCYFLTVGNPSTTLLLSAMSHDLAEHKVGDVASPVKRMFPVLKEWLDVAEENELKGAEINFESLLTDAEKRILKLADNMDGMLFCIREARYGHLHTEEVWTNFYDYTVQLKPEYGIEQQIFKNIISQWEEVT